MRLEAIRTRANTWPANMSKSKALNQRQLQLLQQKLLIRNLSATQEGPDVGLRYESCFEKLKLKV